MSFKRYYPPMDHGFPRRYIDITPQEYLYDPHRILGSDQCVRTRSTGRTRAYGTVFQETVKPCPVSDKAPPSAIPIFKRQVHIDPSRDAETLYATECVEIPPNAVGVTLFTIDGFKGTRTVIRWVDVEVSDALTPSGLTLTFELDGVAQKYMARPNRPGGFSPIPLGPGTTSPTSVNLGGLPKFFHNVLFIFHDDRRLRILIDNAAPANRTVCASVWGWIESETVRDQMILR